MQAEKFVAVVSENVFLDEIHHLLWIDSFKKGGITDLGWNCRDHALILAGVAFELGLVCEWRSFRRRCIFSSAFGAVAFG